MINAPNGLLFDPAGSFGHEITRNATNVLFGITPQVEASIPRTTPGRVTTSSGRTSWCPTPSPRKAYALALAHGPAPKATCTRATSGILRQLPGFESIRTVWLPKT